MLKRIHWARWALLVGALLALWLIFRLIGQFAGIHPYHLVARYPTGDTPTIPPSEAMKRTPEYQKYLDEGRPAVFTASGLYLYEKGGDPFHCSEEEAVIAKHDWTGRRLWAVTLPEGDWRGFTTSPDGEYLATTVFGRGSTLIEVWRDGKLAWDWPDAPFGRGEGYLTDDGRMLLWDDDKLYVAEDGEVIATNEHLPREVWSPNLLAEYRVSPDGSALAGVLQPRRLDPGESYYRDTAPPSFEYQALTIHKRKVILQRKFKIPSTGEAWRFLTDGSVLFDNGMRYAPDGKKSGGTGWQTLNSSSVLDYSMSGPHGSMPDALYIQALDFGLWQGDAMLQYQGTPAEHCRIYLPQSGRAVPVAAGIVTDERTVALQPSEDGRYLLAANLIYDYPTSASGAVARFLGEKGLLPAAAKRGVMESLRFELYDPSGRPRAVLHGRFTPEGKIYIAAARHRYTPLKFTLSPDGRHLVILGQRVDNNKRDYLHFAW